jgi:hypothetical protein
MREFNLMHSVGPSPYSRIEIVKFSPVSPVDYWCSDSEANISTQHDGRSLSTGDIGAEPGYIGNLRLIVAFRQHFKNIIIFTSFSQNN